jgi:kinesin family protein 5
MDSRQADVFGFSIRSTVDDILKGYNGTVFAYGQTGAGKSYTMMGTDIDDEEQKGIIPRIVEQIFASILASPGNIEYTVKVGYLEIYMERIRDLLRPENDNLPIHEEKSRGVYVKDLTELYVSSVGEVYEVMRRGGLARAVAATNMNQESSRSHSIFVVTITQKNVETGSQKMGQLFLVDLAGSEKVGKTGASGQTLEEAKKINKSLSALGMVINSLTDGKSTHIPYRDSKLTRILQESLGGNSRTTLIINCSPSSYNDLETLSTLRFGTRAKSIKNKAKINAELSIPELKVMLKKSQTQVTTYEQYIASLEGEVLQWRTGSPVPEDSWIKSITDGVSKKHLSLDSKHPPSTPSRTAEVRASSRADTPSRPDSRQELLERAGTPSLPLDKDEREEFLRRENELQDQLAEKESQLAHAEKQFNETKEELTFLKNHDTQASRDNDRLTTEVNELRMQVEKMSFEAKEDRISMDGLKEANAELTAELDEVKQHLLEARLEARDTGSLGIGDDKERVKRERMKAMMAGFDLNTMDDSDARGRADALEARLKALQEEHENLLESKLGETDVQSIREKLGGAYKARNSNDEDQLSGLKAEVEKHRENYKSIHAEKEELSRRLEGAGANGDEAALSHSVSRQIAEFDAMKKNLMRDLQNRCERVSNSLPILFHH